MPTHRYVFALRGGDVIDLRGADDRGDLRRLPRSARRRARHDRLAQHGPPDGPGERGGGPRLHDPGRRPRSGPSRPAGWRRTTSAPSSRPTCTPTTSRPCRSSGAVNLHVHEAELATRHAAAVRGALDRAEVHPMSGPSGEVLPGVRWILTPGHTDGHVAYLVDTDEGTVAIVGDTPGPEPRVVRADGAARGLPAPGGAPYGVPRDPRGGSTAHDSGAQPARGAARRADAARKGGRRARRKPQEAYPSDAHRPHTGVIT